MNHCQMQQRTLKSFEQSVAAAFLSGFKLPPNGQKNKENGKQIKSHCFALK